MEIVSFFQSDIRVVKVVDWLNWSACNWSACNSNDVFVALPMIQRGSVWKPNQIIDLWDSLLQGMPIGSLMVSELAQEMPVRRIGQSKSEKVPCGGGLGLIDGQQRTLTMLAAWPLPSGIQMDRRIWIDFADSPEAGQLLRLRVTTSNQPFGFRRDKPSTKLELHVRRKAHDRHEKFHSKLHPPTLENSWPYSFGLSLPIDLRWLVELWVQLDKENMLNEWCKAVIEKLEKIKIQQINLLVNEDAKIEKSEWPDTIIQERVSILRDSLSQIFAMSIPLIRVDSRFFNIKKDMDCDPPLALLFNRIGTGGTKLTDEDYVYSVVKHLQPDTYDLVESLYAPQEGRRNIASFLPATDLVMSAIRLAAIDWLAVEGGQPMQDKESLDKKDFHKLLRHGDFLVDRLLPLIKPEENSSSPKIVQYFSQVQSFLEYRGNADLGLPRHLFPYIGRQLVQVLLRMAQAGFLSDTSNEDQREDLIRLVLFWMVTFQDRKKDSIKASVIAYKVIKDFTLTDSLKVDEVGICQKIYNEFINENISIRLPQPAELKDRPNLVISTVPNKLSRDSRFNPEGDEMRYKDMYDCYRQYWWRPWTHRHPILLWLQREYVATISGDPMASRKYDASDDYDDTPYDYDHILPSSHWKDWSGRNGAPASFAGGEIGIIGNGIGNIRVWDSSKNREDGNISPALKLRLVDNQNELISEVDPPPKMEDLLKFSAILNDDAHINAWIDCSMDGKDYRTWDMARTTAFQQAVETRTFNLYKQYYEDLRFSKWCT